jgi:hypothetical protein
MREERLKRRKTDRILSPMISPEDHSHSNSRDRRVVRVENFTAEEMVAIAKSHVPAEYANLDEELKNWSE